MARIENWNAELRTWLSPFLTKLGHKARRRMCPLYVAGLIGPGDRKSVQPMAERLAPGAAPFCRRRRLGCDTAGERTPDPSRQAYRWQRCGAGDRRHGDSEEGQALGRRCFAIC